MRRLAACRQEDPEDEKEAAVSAHPPRVAVGEMESRLEDRVSRAKDLSRLDADPHRLPGQAQRTDSTGGRCSATARQVSPPSADPKTSPDSAPK